MPGNQARVFSPEFKLAAVQQRLVAGEKVKALAEELGVSRQLLYKWWNHYERGGPAALRLPGRPRPAAAPVIVAANPPRITRGRRRRGRRRLDLKGPCHLPIRAQMRVCRGGRGLVP
jgi:transposase